MNPEALAVLIPIVAIAGWISVAITSIRTKAKTRQLEIQERIAMIQKGLVPAPEADPRGFDRAMNRYDHRHSTSGPARHRRAGITLIGVGLGLMVLLYFVDERSSASASVDSSRFSASRFASTASSRCGTTRRLRTPDRAIPPKCLRPSDPD